MDRYPRSSSLERSYAAEKYNLYQPKQEYVFPCGIT